MRIRFNLLLPGIFCLANTIALYSQQKTYELNAIESGSTKTYVARDQIVMQPGFQFNASNGNNTFNARIDPTLIFPPSDNTYATADGVITQDPTLGGIVGSIPGQFGVSASGGATYSIPIECPPGINGMQPNIALVYNSQSGNGIAGWGWNFSGVSAISRVPKSQYFDGETNGLEWDSYSPIALDGNRLFEIQRWGTDSIEYKTESESFQKVIGYQIQSWGPKYFLVSTKSGQTIQYGNPEQLASYYPLYLKTISRQIIFDKNLKWAISFVRDNNGNSIKYTYAFESHSRYLEMNVWLNIVLDKVEYGGNSNANTAHSVSISFKYIPRVDTCSSYMEGIKMVDTKLLSSINVISNGETIKCDSLIYNYNDNKYHLTSVSRIGVNSTRLNPLTFEWSDNTYSFVKQGNIQTPTTPLVTYYQNLGWHDNIYVQSVYGDINGDGYQDVVYKYTLEKTVGSGRELKGIWGLFLNNNGVFTLVKDTLWDRDYEKSIEFMDQDNDGVDELLIGNDNNGNFFKYKVYKFNRTTNNVNLSTSLNYYYSINNIRKNVIFADFLGIGEPQKLFTYNTSNIFATYYTFISLEDGICYTNPNNGTSQSKILISQGSIPNNNGYYKTFITDVNGNGKAELLYATNNKLVFYETIPYQGPTTPPSLYCNSPSYVFSPLFEGGNSLTKHDRIYPADINGDGKTDLIVNKYLTNIWHFYISTGSSLVERSMSNTLTPYSEIQILDANKDGKSDILFYDYNSSTNQYIFKLLTGTGYSFEEKFTTSFTRNSFLEFRHTGRLYNDKYDDILMISSDYNDHLYKLSNNIQFDKIEKFNDSFKNTTNIVYDRFNSNQIKVFTKELDNETAATKAEVTSSSFGSWDVVKSVTCESNNFNNQLMYEFSNAKIHKKGKGFLGYGTTTVIDPIHSNKQTSISTLNNQFYFLYPTTTIQQLTDGTNINFDSIEYSVSSSGKRYQLKTVRQTSNDVLNEQQSETKYLNYDSWGNPTSVQSKVGSLTELKTVTYGKYGTWCPAQPTCMITSRTLNGSSIERRKDFKYDNRGNLLQETTDSTVVNQVTTLFYDFDNFGHAKKSAIITNGNLRTSSVSYTPSGRFIQSKTNPLGEIVTYNWNNETRALLMSETSRIGTTEYTYDGLGQLIQTKFPNGIRKSNVLQWAENENANGAKYYSYSEISGSAPILTWYDGLGRELVKESYGLNNKTIRTFTEYQDDGKVYRTSEPSFVTTPKKWAATYGYDEYGRIDSVSTPAGISSTVYDGLTTTQITPNSTQIHTNNSSGMLEYSMKNGKRVDFSYYPSGLTKTSTPVGGNAITMEYDLLGNRTKLIDPDGGTVESKYNGLGEMLWSCQDITNGSKDSTSNNFDSSTGLIQSTKRDGETITYDYDNLHRIKSIEIVGKNRRSFDYDAFDRVISQTETIGNRSFTTKTGYDAIGREKTHIYPSGYTTVNYYDYNGILTKVSDLDGRIIYEPLDVTAKGQMTKVNRGGLQTDFGFDDRGYLTSINSPGIIKLNYNYLENGNLEYRIDSLTNQKQLFGYDELNRLIDWNIFNGNTTTPVKECYQSFDSNGNIESRSDLENLSMTYRDNGKSHALNTIDGKPESFPLNSLSVTYTAFKKIATLNEGTKTYTLSYGIDNQRCQSIYTAGGSTSQTRYYLGDYEEETTDGIHFRKIHYLSGGAVLIRNNGKDSLLYGYSDHQGSLIALTNGNGIVLEKYAYDPWGLRRNPLDWTQSDNRTSHILNRGYTGHEHIDPFAIINMNGRVYDPLTGMFLSPDPQLQDPDNWLNYNRYAYCYNNPLIYTDPTGEFIIEAMMIGAFINATTQVLSGNVHNAGDFFTAVGIGALSGLAGGGAGQLVSGAVGAVGFAGGAMTGAAGGFAGGFVGGAGNAWAGGASFGQGLEKGLICGGSGAVTGGLIGGISGGIFATKHGGNFWSGKGTTVDALAVPTSSDIIETGEGMDYTNNYAQTFSDENFGESVKGVSDFYADGTLPPGYLKRGDVVLNTNGQSVRGSTWYLGTGKGSNVYLYKAAFISKDQLYLTMGHEYLHAGYFSTGLINTNSQHSSIYEWEAYQAKAFGVNETLYANRYVSFKPYYNSAYDFSKLGFYILNIKPW